MTTLVRVEVHVEDDREVLMQLSENGKILEEYVLQDLEKIDGYVHGDQVVSVREVLKKKA